MTMSSVPVITGDSTTDGTWLHTGHLIVSLKLSSGTVVTLKLPEDWQALKALVPNSLEDLTYGG
jgi:hypothetical protein